MSNRSELGLDNCGLLRSQTSVLLEEVICSRLVVADNGARSIRLRLQDRPSSNLATAASTVWTEAGFLPSSSTVGASYPCRIGLAIYLAATVVISKPIHFASVRFLPTSFCDFHKIVPAASFPNSAGCNGRHLNCGSVVLLQDRSSQQQASSLAASFQSTCGRSLSRDLATFHKLAQTLWALPLAACCGMEASDRLGRMAAEACWGGVRNHFGSA